MDLTLKKPETISALLVEDSRGDALLVSELLQRECRADLEMCHVDRLADACRRLRSSHFDCLLLDLSLPDADWLEALTKVRTVAPDTPVVILSGFDNEMLAVKAVRAGAQDYLVKGQFDGLVLDRSIQYAIERKRVEVKLARAAMHDPLTDLPNRALFIDRLEQALARAQRDHSQLALLSLDLKDFKLITDSLGVAVADQLLMAAAKRMSDVLRASETLARFENDQFAVLCESIPRAEEAVRIADRILEALDTPFCLEDGTVFITASIGVLVVASLDANAGAELLVRAADAAMERAKKDPKGSHGLTYYGAKDQIGGSSRPEGSPTVLPP